MAVETTRAVFGCSGWRDYAFSLPIAAMLWRRLPAFEPLIFLVEGESFWSEGRNAVVLRMLRRFNFDVRFIGHIKGYEHATIAQSIRQHSACLSDIDDLTWLMMTDADMWPLTNGWFKQHETANADIILYYANGDHGQSYPTCYQTMKSMTWREVMRLDAGTSPSLALVDTFVKYLPTDGFAVWMFDQHYSSRRIQEWEATHPNRTIKIDRRGHPPVDRLDRSAWPATYRRVEYIDAHIFKAPDSHPNEPQHANNWPRLSALVQDLLPEIDLDRYRHEFVLCY